jgi:hypothetical protein
MLLPLLEEASHLAIGRPSVASGLSGPVDIITRLLGSQRKDES